jgi:hypothetical protein
MGWLHLVRAIHVGLGAFWVGAVVVLAFVVIPSIRAVGPAGGPVMEQMAGVRRLPHILMGAAVLTILSGFALYWRDSSGFQGAWVRSGPGITFLAGGVLALIAAIHGAVVNSPTAKRLGLIAADIRQAGGPPSPAQAQEIQQLQNRLAGAVRVAAVLISLAVLAMSVARYVP